MPKRAIIIPIALASLLAAVVAPVEPERTPPVQEKRVEVVTEKRVIVKVPGKRPDGLISQDDCALMPLGMTMSDVMFIYGWPAGNNSSYTGTLRYPIREDHNAKCIVDTFNFKVNAVAYSVN